jgi:hypothetical protein
LNEEQTAELSRLNVGVAAVFQKGWLSPVLMKVDMWDDRYETTLELTDPADLRYVKGNLLRALYEQKASSRFSPMKLRSITRASSLPVDKKRELDDIILSYNDKFTAGAPFDKKHFGNLLLEMIGCEQLFSVIPLDGIPAYREYMEYAAGTEEFSKLLDAYEMGSFAWLEKFMSALSYYVTLTDEAILTETVVDLLYVCGSGGNIQDPKKSKLPMLCRMIYRKLGLSLK